MIKPDELKLVENKDIPFNITSVKNNGKDLKKINESHKVQVTTVAMLATNKLPILKSSSGSNGVVTTEKASNLLEKGEVYQERKRMLPEYKDLFAALLKLPNKDIQRKIFDVINNHKSVEQRSVETQTDFTESEESANISIDNTISKQINADKVNEILNKEEIKPGNVMTPTDEPKKRKRKRKVSLPQANKESRTKQIVKMNKPKATYTNNSCSSTQPLSHVKAEVEINNAKYQRIDSSFSECGSDVTDIFEDVEANPLRELEASAIPLENGLLPIQDALVKNQVSRLWIHIRIWKEFRNFDLNDLITNDDEDLLQLAILNRCDPTIVHLLLEHGLNSDCLDGESNTIIHLAILNDIDFSSMELLMKKIDLNLLLTLNDEGYTPLHLAIRQDRFLLAESLMNVLDERLTNKIFYKLEFDQLETDEVLLKKEFKIYYEKICLNMNPDEESIPKNHELKQQLLQTGDRRSGNIALYFAIDNKYEHLIYFLLAHLTDPRTKNLGDQDCKSFFVEYGKTLNLSLNIDNTMEKVITILSYQK